ncbi:MAG: CARDB domain-containing protein [Dehalococcoidia bacterium]
MIIPGWIRPDLFPTNAAIVERSGPWRGGTRTYFEFTVRNGGLLPAGPFTITVRMSGFPDRTITAVALLPGQSQTFRELTERPGPGGCRTYDVFVDSGDAVVEMNEGNNVDSVALCGTVPAG